MYQELKDFQRQNQYKELQRPGVAYITNNRERSRTGQVGLREQSPRNTIKPTNYYLQPVETEEDTNTTRTDSTSRQYYEIQDY